MRRARWALGAAAGLATLAGAGAAGAHHSFAMFDSTKEVTFEGTVVEMKWTNPHSWLELTAPSPSDPAKMAQWGLEMQPPTAMRRQGWTASAVKPGDKVTVVVNPMKDGRAGGALIRITLPDGKVLGRQRRLDN